MRQEREIVMQERKVFSLPIFALLALLTLISCTPKAEATELLLSSTNTPILQSALASTTTATEKPKVTEATPTYAPTLDPDAAYKQLESIFKGRNCDFPCWWGIEPGFTSISDAEAKLNDYYRIESSDVIKDGLLLLFDVSILRQENISDVNAIRVHEEVLRPVTDGYDWVYDEQIYTDLLDIYSLKSILNTYGKPSDIFATVEIYNTEPNAPDFMMIWLLYPEKGFIAKYTANAELNNEIVTGCPTKSFFTFWLFPPNTNENYKQLKQLDPDLGYIVPTLSERTKPISEAFGISADEFYKTFTKSNDKCLETPYNIWSGW